MVGKRVSANVPGLGEVKGDALSRAVSSGAVSYRGRSVRVSPACLPVCGVYSVRALRVRAAVRRGVALPCACVPRGVRVAVRARVVAARVRVRALPAASHCRSRHAVRVSGVRCARCRAGVSRVRCSSGSELGPEPWPPAELPCYEPSVSLRGGRGAPASCPSPGRSVFFGRHSTVNSELARTRGIRLSN